MLVTRSVLFAVAFYATTAVMLIGGLWLLLAPRSWAMAGLKLHGRIALKLLEWICGTHIEVRGRERIPPGACLVAAKHQSTWDTFALLTLFDDPAIVLKDELKYIPVYGWFCLKFEHLLVKRERAAVALRHLVADAKARIAAGRQIVIFPEGTRRNPDAAPDYKPGYVALYEAVNVPCVPIALNSGIYWPRRSLIRHPGTIVVAVLEPIAPGLPRAEFRRQFEQRLEAATAQLVKASIAERAGGNSQSPGAIKT
jgi:1-acyl-sn-glycerol-3-phosphate acyltransferase